MARLADLMHRTLFKAVSLLGSKGQGAVLRRYFDWWHRRPDPWHLSTDSYERRKYLTTLGQVPAGSYGRILEVGCSEGVFTELLATTYPEAEVTGVDISETALERARERAGGLGERVRFVHADLLEHDLGERYDLVFCAETLYYVGRGDRLRHASDRLGALLAPGGLLVLVHPWPESQRLHGHADAALSKVGERVDHEAWRPYAVSLYQGSTRVALDAT
ncbi:class I SAM-dependent methyltransferase [Nonomuraea sp. NPDC046802]|uniref:class I SAM-dependent methyltransferase n=1 Tax=Nonomuraea sp. NPDC046802 TaxID=3154919 RepID=UPI0033DF1228